MDIRKFIDSAQEDLKVRSTKFIDEYNELKKKYEVDIMASLSIKEEGILPQLKVVDIKSYGDTPPVSNN